MSGPDHRWHLEEFDPDVEAWPPDHHIPEGDDSEEEGDGGAPELG